jgi:hypothetical protein
MIRAVRDAEVELYYDGSKKFETTSYGVLVADSSGNADAVLKIEAEAGADAYLALDTSNGGGATADVRFQMDGTTKGSIEYVNAGSDANCMLFRTNDNSEKLRVDSSGNVMFGTAQIAVAGTVGYKFKADSSHPYMSITTDISSAGGSNYHVYNKNASYNGYRFYVRNDGGVAAFESNNIDLCDEREKKAIVDAPSQLATIKSWKIRNFRYNEQEDSEPLKIGVIAQEIESVNPELVTDDFKVRVDDSGNDVLRKGVKEQQMTMISIKALQELIEKVETLETKVAALSG